MKTIEEIEITEYLNAEYNEVKFILDNGYIGIEQLNKEEATKLRDILNRFLNQYDPPN